MSSYLYVLYSAPDDPRELMARVKDLGENRTVKIYGAYPLLRPALTWGAMVKRNAMYIAIQPGHPYLRWDEEGGWTFNIRSASSLLEPADSMPIAATTVREAMQTYIALEFMT